MPKAGGGAAVQSPIPYRTACRRMESAMQTPQENFEERQLWLQEQNARRLRMLKNALNRAQTLRRNVWRMLRNTRRG